MCVVMDLWLTLSKALEKSAKITSVIRRRSLSRFLKFISCIAMVNKSCVLQDGRRQKPCCLLHSIANIHIVCKWRCEKIYMINS